MAWINITLRQLRAFVVVADHESFVAASAVLGLSQPALSQSIRQLEDQIGGALFHRTTRRVKLTDLGTNFLPSVRQVLRQFDAAVNDVQDVAARKRGRVVVACLPSVAYRLMPLVLARNEELHQKVRVTIRDGNLKFIIEAIASGEAQLGVASFTNPHPPLDSVPIARDRFFAVFPRGHELEAKKTVRWTDLERYPFISMTHETGIRDLVDHAIASMNIKLKIFSEVTNLATVNGMLEENLGISILPGLVLPRADHPFIGYRPLEKPELVRTIRLIWRHDIGLSRSAVAIIDTLSEILIEGRLREGGGAIELHDGFDDKVIKAASRRNAF